MFEESENLENETLENNLFDLNVENSFLLSHNDHMKENNTNETTKKENYFQIEKNPKMKNLMREKKERIKILLGEKTEREKNYFISNGKVYRTSDNLSKEEKNEIRKIQNRISAQKSRNQQKQLIIDLRLENKKLKEKIEFLENEIKNKNGYINKLSFIINDCSICQNKISNNLNFSIFLNQDNFSSNNNISFFSKSSLSIFTILCLLLGIIFLFNIDVNKKKNQRNLYETNYTKLTNNIINNNSIKIFSNYNSSNIFNWNKENYYIMKDENLYEKTCENYLNAKITKDLDFENLLNHNQKCFDFRMIIPCKNNKNYNETTTPIIALKNSNYYNEIIKNLGNNSFYEINCRINSINKYKNSKCKNNFLN